MLLVLAVHVSDQVVHEPCGVTDRGMQRKVIEDMRNGGPGRGRCYGRANAVHPAWYEKDMHAGGDRHLE